MAHYARLDANNVVEQVIVIDNDKEPTEAAGQAYCTSLFGGNWKKTSYNGTIRKNFAGQGYTYDMIRDAFIAPKPYPSWTFNETTCRWSSPVEQPSGIGPWYWDEITETWINRA